MCGQVIEEAELIDKILSIFSPATAILSQQYRNMKFKKLSKLMSHLLLVEKHHQILLRNAESRPTWEVHNTIVKLEEVAPEEPNRSIGAIIHAEGAGPR